MEKSKIGLSIPVIAGIIYLSALLGYIPLIICAGYALVFEESKLLKRHAVSAIMFVGIIAIISTVLFSIITSILGIFNVPLEWITQLTDYKFTFRLAYPFNLDRIISYLLTIIEDAGLIAFAFAAFKGKKAMKFANKFVPDDIA